jgi:hypothetical protein
MHIGIQSPRQSIQNEATFQALHRSVHSVKVYHRTRCPKWDVYIVDIDTQLLFTIIYHMGYQIREYHSASIGLD